MSASSSEPTKFSKLTKDLDEKVSSFSNSIASKLEMLKQKLASKKKKNGDSSRSEANQPTSNVLQAQSTNPLYAVHDDLIEVSSV